MRYLSETQLNKLLSCVQEKGKIARRRGTTRAIIDELLISLLVHTGLRPAELCTLSIGDLVTGHAENMINVRDARGNVSRSVHVTADMAKYLEKFVRLYRSQAKPNDPFLVNERGNQFTYASLYNKVRRIGKQAKIDKLHPHMLRATYLVRLYRTDQDLRFVQQQAGHASPKTTAMYAIASNDRDEQLVEPHHADSGTVERPHSPSREPITEKSRAERAIHDRETVLLKGLQQAKKCDACGKAITPGDGTRIDSGQVLCRDCLDELRNR